MANTFDGVTLTNPGMPRYEFSSGSIISVTLTCKTTSYTDVTNLLAKTGPTAATLLLNGKQSVQTLGTSGTLVLGSDTFTKCAIMPPVQVERLAPSVWQYTVKFVQDTTT